MSELEKLLSGYTPPPVPAGLAERAAAQAIARPQEPGRAAPRRRDRRGGWRRPLWIGTAGFSLAFTSAVAATVVSGGRIEIPVVQPVVQEVVEAVPVLHRAQAERAPERLAVVEKQAPAAEPAEAAPIAPRPGEPGYGKAQVMRKLAEARQQVEARRAAGLPTPGADRIERQAKAIVERRQAAGLPTPTIEEVEAGLALRELRRVRVARNIQAAAISDRQLAQIAERLPADKREQFLALPPYVQRQLIVRQLEKLRARRIAARQSQLPAEGYSEPPR